MLTHSWITGRSHRLAHVNCHDFAVTGRGPEGCYLGLVLDGCGSKFKDENGRYAPQSEVGAQLLGRFSANWLATQINPDSDLVDLATWLPLAAEGFLTNVVDQLHFADAAGRRRFIFTHLLATMVGFLVTPQAALFFWLGDGYLCQNGVVTTLESDNRPEYLAYGLLGASRPEMGWQLLRRESLAWLAVATDGWTPALLAQVDPGLDQLALQRWLNVRARQVDHFSDDGAIALCQLTPPTGCASG